MANATSWRFWIDTGGTFTDCLAQTPAGDFRRLKVLSSGAVRGAIGEIRAGGVVGVQGGAALPQDFFAGYDLRDIQTGATARVRASNSATPASMALALEGDSTFPVGAVIDLFAGEEAPVLAMRMLTGTPLSARLPPSELRLATTRGTNALLEGKGARVAFFVTEGFADLLRIGDQRRPDLFALRVQKPPPLHDTVVEVRERLAADGSVVRAIDLSALREQAASVLNRGVTVAAVALLHSHMNPAHERAVAALLREIGFAHVSVSTELAPFIKLLPRAETAVVDAVLAPVMEHYLAGVAGAIDATRLWVMTSAGGLVRRAAYRPKDSLLSGPAGGVAGAAAVARRAGFARVLTFDMGGTSTDVGRWAGDFDFRFQHTVGNARVLAPAVRVESVAAGGGSICRFDGSAFVVGPESAGAYPGPACYGAGGPLTLTDVNLLLGRLDPSTFALPVTMAAAEEKLAALLDQVRARSGPMPKRAEVLEGLLAIADERMAEAIRRISVREGYDPAEHVLVAFGGAGGVHACAVAERLGVRQILFPADSGLLSAAGLRHAVPERFAERQMLTPLERVGGALGKILAELEAEARAALTKDEIGPGVAEVRRAELELRYEGQESTLVIAAQPISDVAERFRAAHVARYGYAPAAPAIELVTVRVVVSLALPPTEHENFAVTRENGSAPPRLVRGELSPGTALDGPRLIADGFSTLFVAEGWRAVVGSAGSLLIEHKKTTAARVRASTAMPVELALFTCRFMALVDEMGGLLQRCALSVNVKERLDFSCALLDAAGNLVANAPHIPVHLGALGLCVRRLRESIAMEPGDVVVTNHPAFGGSHLPDVTLVAPVHDEQGGLLGFVANRAHHAEIGGMKPGSMSPEARRLSEEGVVIPPLHLVRAESAHWDVLRELLTRAPYPSRAVEENLADLHAQLAAIRHGAAALHALAQAHGRDRVREFMSRLQTRAAEAVATALARLPARDWRARDALDDGTILQAACGWTAGPGSRLRIDFTGSGPVHRGNLNATPAIVQSATLYVLRVLAGAELPLNEGLMRDVDLIVARGGILAPDFSGDAEACPAVAGGNVETSQRVVDVLLQAFVLAACSQGTMNNLILGTSRISYYETIGGGTGAGPGFRGCDAVHSHMTNTAITDPEVLERRLPVRVERFGIRRCSGGRGEYAGGDGIERHLMFLEPCSLSLLTQRRRIAPPGGAGGGDGQTGAQWLERANGTRENLDPCAQTEVSAGDRLALLTPGGGGWGRES